MEFARNDVGARRRQANSSMEPSRGAAAPVEHDVRVAVAGVGVGALMIGLGMRWMLPSVADECNEE